MGREKRKGFSSRGQQLQQRLALKQHMLFSLNGAGKMPPAGSGEPAVVHDCRTNLSSTEYLQPVSSNVVHLVF